MSSRNAKIGAVFLATVLLFVGLSPAASAQGPVDQADDYCDWAGEFVIEELLGGNFHRCDLDGEGDDDPENPFPR